MKILLAPHQDDAVLFSTFTLLRERPLVINVLESHIQPSRGYVNCEATIRNFEEATAVSTILGCNLCFLGYRDDNPDWNGVEESLRQISEDNDIAGVYAPAIEDGGHEHHNRIGLIADLIWPRIVTHYMTYTRSGKSTGAEVFYQPEWVRLKLRALACYESQIFLPNCVEHFIRAQAEYYQP